MIITTRFPQWSNDYEHHTNLKKSSNKCSSALVTMHAGHCTSVFDVSTAGVVRDSLNMWRNRHYASTENNTSTQNDSEKLPYSMLSPQDHAVFYRKKAQTVTTNEVIRYKYLNNK